MSRIFIFNIRILSVGIALALALVSTARTEENRAHRHRLIPDHLKFQYAGNMGFISIGTGYSILGGHVHSDVFYGYAPISRCGEHIHQITWKNTVLPGSIRLSKRIQWTPVAAGAHLSCKVGNNNRETWVILPNRYPKNYYPPTAVHLLLTVGTCFDYRIPGSSRRAGMFLEAGTTALYLRNWLRERHVSLHDILNVSCGIRRPF